MIKSRTHHIDTNTSMVKCSNTMNTVKYSGETYVKSLGLTKKHASNKITTVVVGRFARYS